ncbi:MAG: DUF2945 domain-containing protein [Devosia sp.]
MTVRKGDKVRWTWGAHHADGVVQQKFTRRVKRSIKGQTIVRNATEDEPAYLVVQEDGGRALKSASELEKR